MSLALSSPFTFSPLSLMLPLAKDSHSCFNLILATGSPRRIELFRRLGFKFQAVPSNFPENLDKAAFACPIDYIKATCQGKIDSITAVGEDDLIVACDTVVLRSSSEILEKPATRAEACEMIKSLLGSSIKVCSVVCMRRGERVHCFEEVSEVLMRAAGEIEAADLEGYLDSCNYTDLAGGLAVQEAGMILVKAINGCFFNVMGFPMSRFYQEMRVLLG